MIQIAICDDEEIFVQQIHDEAKRILIEKNVEFEISDYTDGRKLLEEKEFKKFDLVLLDIDMPEIGGFEVAKELNFKSQLIFITSHSELVYDCFDFHPFYFLRKDDLHSLKKAIDKYIDLFKKEYLDIQDTLKSKSEKIYLNDLAFIKSEGHYCIFYFVNSDSKKIRVSLSEIENEFLKKNFVRSHKSYIINLKFISNVDLSSNYVNLNINNIALPLGRNFKTEVQKKFLIYKRGLV